jgi:hypothetical protein
MSSFHIAFLHPLDAALWNLKSAEPFSFSHNLENDVHRSYVKRSNVRQNSMTCHGSSRLYVGLKG